MIKRETLNTEKQNDKTVAIDQISTSEALKTINDEDQKVSIAVRKALPEIEKVVNLAKTALVDGGRVFYIGAGTSGRLGVLDDPSARQLTLRHQIGLSELLLVGIKLLGILLKEQRINQILLEKI